MEQTTDATPTRDRRASPRYPLAQKVRYITSGKRVPAKMGFGLGVDLSSSGISFITDTPLLIGQGLTVYIDWPVLLNYAIELQLMIRGIVVRTNETRVAIKILKHDFRTRGVGQRPV